MGNVNAIASCLIWRPPTSRTATVVLPGGAARLVGTPCPAAAVLVDFPDQLLCDADCFFLNHRLPSLTLHDDLAAGRTYLLLPSEKFASPVFSAASIAALSDRKRPISFGESPFECVRDAQGESAIKVSREFLVRVLAGAAGKPGEEEARLCSTPELRRHYEQLVGTGRVQPWSPGLETIAEASKGRGLALLRLSPARLVESLMTP